MPNLDGTGPAGLGPRTGRGLGYGTEAFKLTPEQRSMLAVAGIGLSFLGGMISLFLAVTGILEAKESQS